MAKNNELLSRWDFSNFSIPTFFLNVTRKNFWIHLCIMANSLFLLQQKKLPLLPIEPQIEAYLEMLKRLENISFDFSKLLKNKFIENSHQEPNIRYGALLKRQFFHSAYPMIFEDELVMLQTVGSGTYSNCLKCNLKYPIFALSSEKNLPIARKKFYVYKKLKYIMNGNQTLVSEDLTEGNATVAFQGITRLLKPLALIIRLPSATSKGKSLRMRGYLFEWAEFGDLSIFLQSNIIPLNWFFIQNVMRIADGLNEIHSRGFIHRDVRVENVFVKRGPKEQPYKLILGDFGLCCRTGPQGNCDALSPFDGWERTRIYPRELFDKKLALKLSPATDWFEFGTLLKSIGNRWDEGESNWISLMSPLITTLTRKNMSSGDRWGYKEVRKYFEMLLEQEFFPSFVFTFAFVVCPAEKQDEIYHLQVGHCPKPHSISFQVLYDYSVCFKGGFFPMSLAEGEITTLNWKREDEERMEKSISIELPKVYKFIKCFPFPITSDVTHMEKTFVFHGRLSSASV